jgi:hypothetical protein
MTRAMSNIPNHGDYTELFSEHLCTFEAKKRSSIFRYEFWVIADMKKGTLYFLPMHTRVAFMISGKHGCPFKGSHTRIVFSLF